MPTVAPEPVPVPASKIVNPCDAIVVPAYSPVFMAKAADEIETAPPETLKLFGDYLKMRDAVRACKEAK